MISQPKPDIFTVVLTGGVASGKSAAAEFFAELGVPIIDTDIIAREVVAPDTNGLRQIIELFGDQVLTANGQLNRRLLREIIFADKQKRQQLEALLHPLIERAALQQLQTLANQSPPPAYAMIAVPLYAETQTFRWADRILVIDVSSQTQINRLQARDQINHDLARKMLAAQTSRQQRLSIADDVIVNEGTLDQLRQYCQQQHQQYLACQ